jgi:predicted PurR-regulated permease PerM
VSVALVVLRGFHYMSATKKIIPVLAILLGVAGIVVCAIGIVGTWKVRNQFDTTIASTFDLVDESLGRVGGLAEQTNQRIEGVQSSIENLNDRVQSRVAELRDVSQEEAADIDEIERQLYVRIQHARNVIEFTRTSVDLVQQLLAMAQSTSAFLQDDSHSALDLAKTVKAGHEEIEQTQLLADEIRTALVEVRASRNLKENAEKVRTISSRIDASLSKIEAYGERFETGVVQLRSDATNMGERILQRLLILAIAVTVFLVWMACGQFCLACHGRRTLQLH